MGRKIAAAAGALTVLIVALEVAYGADLGSVLLYLAYELVFVVVPGCLLVAALRPELRGTLTGFAIGWAAGYVVEILAFDLTAALSIRGAFYAYPLLVAAAALPLILRGRAGDEREDGPPMPALGGRDLALIAALCCLGVLYVGISLFASTLLPGDGNTGFNQDIAWAISLAADLLNHFPLSDPNVAGEPLVYHYFVSAHMAAASQVTGIDLPLIFLRLYALPLVVCAAVGFAAAGQRLFGNVTTGTVAGGLSLLIGEVQLDPRTLLLGQVVFLGVLFLLILVSPSFLFGIVILIPLVIVIAERLRSGRGTPAQWALVALLAVGASGAKVTILPLLGLALVLYGGWLLVRTHRLPRAAVISTAIVLGVELLLYVDQYRGHASGVELSFSAGYDFIQGMPAIMLLKDGVLDLAPDLPGLGKLLGVLAVPTGLLGLFGAQLAGIWLYLRRRDEPVPEVGVFLLCVLVAAALGMAFLIDPDVSSQLYYVFYGSVAASLLSAAGLVDSWSAAGAAARRPMLLLLAAGAGALAVVIAVPALALGSGRLPTPGATWAWYGGFLALLTVIWLVGRAKLPGRGLAAVVVCSLVVAAGVMDTPVDQVLRTLKHPATASETRTNLTPGLHEALIWVRENTDTDAVLATSNPGVVSFDYAAFGERRMFLGGWGYSMDSREAGYGAVSTGAINPFADRLAVNQAAFAGDETALDALRAAGVDYLFIDKVNGPPADAAALEDAGTVVFENADATIIEL